MLSYRVEPTSSLPVGVHNCELVKADEEDGKFGRQLYLDFACVSGEHGGKSIRAWASLENERGPITPTPKNRIGRFLLALTGAEKIEQGTTIAPARYLGHQYDVEVVQGTSGAKVEGFSQVSPRGHTSLDSPPGMEPPGSMEAPQGMEPPASMEAPPSMEAPSVVSFKDEEGEDLFGPKYPTAVSYREQIEKAKKVETLNRLWAEIQGGGNLLPQHRASLYQQSKATAEKIRAVAGMDAAQPRMFEQ